MNQKKAYLSLGSNIGDRLHFLKQATNRLNEHGQMTVMNISSVYETAAWGFENQNDFYNMAVEMSTSLSPEALLEVCQSIEIELERVRDIHWGPRTIDIDILWYENVEMDHENLTIPHKYLLERPFVTLPLTEIAPDVSVAGVKVSTVAAHHEKAKEKCLKLNHVINVHT
ncbi:MAG: 2-amino-4-hydroxy-6-hydroxymethyldihydropteridine diphosphokinase [Defluviitaleaceae bacterium]|nr:2-amino-4-hydroxy-6-hydroxymethyldihydropteridine diphosphokinase [Defluviitaleaceae bacterium]